MEVLKELAGPIICMVVWLVIVGFTYIYIKKGDEK
jgi:hypothetical protein